MGRQALSGYSSTVLPGTDLIATRVLFGSATHRTIGISVLATDIT